MIITITIIVIIIKQHHVHRCVVQCKLSRVHANTDMHHVAQSLFSDLKLISHKHTVCTPSQSSSVQYLLELVSENNLVFYEAPIH